MRAPVIAGLLFVSGLLPPLQNADTATIAVPASHAARVVARDVVWIEGGWFSRGSDEADVTFAVQLCMRDPLDRGIRRSLCLPELFLEETPRRRIWVSRFGIDRTEVTQSAWRRCVADNRCPPSRMAEGERHAAPDHPIAGITWGEARRYCDWVGGRLPTEAEWERAARGHDGRRFPWGDFYNDRLANHGRVLTTMSADPIDGFRNSAPVGSFPSGRSPFGALDMAGNVFEWTQDAWAPESYASDTRIDPTGPAGGGERVVRGGSWRWPAFALRATHRYHIGEQEARADVGVRCAYDAR